MSARLVYVLKLSLRQKLGQLAHRRRGDGMGGLPRRQGGGNQGEAGMTMRERLCLAAAMYDSTEGGAMIPESILRTGSATDAAVNVFGDFVDAILAELRVPDAAMLGAGRVHTELEDIFTAMIDIAWVGP